MVPIAHAQNTFNFTIDAGKNETTTLKYCLNCFYGNCKGGANAQASAEGTAANWADPDYLDFGYVRLGACSAVVSYAIEVPAGTPGGIYTLDWYETCQSDNASTRCYSAYDNYTIMVNGAGTTTTETTTINGESLFPCAPDEHIGGIPGEYSSQFCYSEDMSVAERGSASVIDLTGSPTDTFIVGDLAWTEADSSLSVRAPTSAPGYSLSLGPDTLGAMIQAIGSPTSGFSSPEDQYPSYYQAFDEQALNFGMHLSSALLTHAALNQFSLLGKAGVLTTTMIVPPITMLEVGYGAVHLTESTLQHIGWGVKCLVSPSMLACPEGTDFTMTVGSNGTTLSIINGSILVDSLSANSSTPKYILLNAGQRLFIPNNQTQANQQNLTSSVKTFALSATSTISQNATSSTQSISIAGMTETQTVATLFIFVMIIVIALRLYRQRKK